MTSRLTVFLVAIGSAAAVAGLVYLHGYQRGAESERIAILTRSMDVLRERTKVDDQIRDMDSAGLCAALGGSVMPDGTCQ